MLAERLPGLLPVLDDAAALELTAIQSVAGTLPEHGLLSRRAPFQAPHHTASVAALVGGGSGLARPGAISLAHTGILFLDEANDTKTSLKCGHAGTRANTNIKDAAAWHPDIDCSQ